MNEMVVRFAMTGISMFVGFMVTKQLERSKGIVTSYINIMKEKKDNLQSHGLILAVMMIIGISVLSAIFRLTVVVETAIVGVVLGAFYFYFTTLQKQVDSKNKYQGAKKKKK